MTRNLKLIIAYDGARYQGWQRLGGNENTIQQKLETVLSRILEEPITINGSGRTDAGAHARMQVASFPTNSALPTTAILARLRHYLPEDMGAMSLEDVQPRFHARLNAQEKTYVYRVWNTAQPNVFERRYQHQLPAALELDAMRRAAQAFLGTHDYLAFCANKHFKKSSVRTVRALEIERAGEEVRFTVTGDGFLHHMVRIMVGTLLEIGQGLRAEESIDAIFASGRRETAGETAPAKGLCLWEVVY